MSRVRVEGFTISIDGFGAGPNQSLKQPLGEGGDELHRWLLGTRTFQKMHFGKEEGTTGLDDEFAGRGMQGVGAWILGRNMFSPHRGVEDQAWKGWWGDEPPYHVPVFVLTHYPRPPLEMKGGTTFHFVTEGPKEALIRAKAAAGQKDVRIGGGIQTIQQYLQEGVIDELHLAIAPILLGRGEHLFQGLNLRAAGYRCVKSLASELATHVVIRRD